MIRSSVFNFEATIFINRLNSLFGGTSWRDKFTEHEEDNDLHVLYNSVSK